MKADEWDQVAAAIGTAPENVRAAYSKVIELAIEDANDYATHPDTPEEKRAGWCGRERGLTDLQREIEVLRSGEYRNWPGYQAEEQQRREEAKQEEG